MAEKSVYLCVLLWAHPGRAAALAAYEDRVLALLPCHGGLVVRRGAVTGDDSGGPDEIQLLEFLSEAGMDAYLNDPRRLAMAADRDEVIARTDVHRFEPRDLASGERGRDAARLSL